MQSSLLHIMEAALRPVTTGLPYPTLISLLLLTLVMLIQAVQAPPRAAPPREAARGGRLQAGLRRRQAAAAAAAAAAEEEDSDEPEHDSEGEVGCLSGTMHPVYWREAILGGLTWLDSPSCIQGHPFYTFRRVYPRTSLI